MTKSQFSNRSPFGLITAPFHKASPLPGHFLAGGRRVLFGPPNSQSRRLGAMGLGGKERGVGLPVLFGR